MESLYVCLFSNGHIKVGRSIEPKSRIATHVDRVACMGVTLSDSFVVASADEDEAREQALIAKCVEASSRRHRLEWFEGLAFDQVCQWAREVALADLERGDSAVRGVRQRLRMAQSDLAAVLGCTQANIGFIERRGQTLMPEMAKRLIRFAASKGEKVTYEDLYGRA
jgi:putative transcriptional regulator